MLDTNFEDVLTVLALMAMGAAAGILLTLLFMGVAPCC